MSDKKVTIKTLQYKQDVYVSRCGYGDAILQEMTLMGQICKVIE